MSEIDRLDELLREVSTCAKPQYALVLEHLQSARFYMYGAMPQECLMSLTMAMKQLKYVDDHRIRTLIEDFIRTQLHDRRYISQKGGSHV
jgi:hypothetical protein